MPWFFSVLQMGKLRLREAEVWAPVTELGARADSPRVGPQPRVWTRQAQLSSRWWEEGLSPTSPRPMEQDTHPGVCEGRRGLASCGGSWPEAEPTCPSLSLLWTSKAAGDRKPVLGGWVAGGVGLGGWVEGGVLASEAFPWSPVVPSHQNSPVSASQLSQACFQSWPEISVLWRNSGVH